MGEVSAAAEADGVEAGMPLCEALARCPSLRLVPSDPVGVAERWDRLLERLEGIGAAVESERPGEAFFEVDGLLGIHGGDLEGVIAAAGRRRGRGSGSRSPPIASPPSSPPAARRSSPAARSAGSSPRCRSRRLRPGSARTSRRRGSWSGP